MTILKAQNAKSLKQIVSTNYPHLKQLIKFSEHLHNLNKILQQTIDTESIKHCELASFENGQMVVIVENASWATKLRYSLPEIIKTLKIQPEFKNLKTIRYKIDNHPQKQIKKPFAPKNKNAQAKARALNKIAQKLKTSKIK